MAFLERTELLLGKEKLEKLKQAKVILFGLGGVGSYVAEGLVRAGIGHFILVDHDTISLSNCNRQIIATTKTIGQPKVEVEKQRMLEINPEVIVETSQEFYLPKEPHSFRIEGDYIIDAIDTVSAKIGLIEEAKQHNIPILSCMGTGNKLDPTRFKIADISKTKICPLAKVVRKELRKRNIEQVKVLYSEEEPIKIEGERTPGSISFVPSVAGLMIAAEVVKDIMKASDNIVKK